MKKKLNECYNNNESIETNIKDHLYSLAKYMLNKFDNIKPLPKIILIHDDHDNANQILGKTGHYSPDEMQIVIYTSGRHPKDIIRSFAHEMIHHKQNIEGRLPLEIDTVNVNENGELAELEKEAYTEGNMAMREWENKIKQD
jgi:hypothetical protein